MSDDAEEDLFGNPAHPKRPMLQGSPAREPRPPKEAPPTPVYLWLRCEGWVRFGPFEWLFFDDESGAVFGPNGEIAAWREGPYWRVTDPRRAGMAFDAITLTTARKHPFQHCGTPEFLHKARQSLSAIRK